MSKLIRILLMMSLASMFVVTTVFAEGMPVGSCPKDFMLHMAADHDDHHGNHVHIGTDTDLNGDGYICMKPITPDGTIHVHVDNYLMLGATK